MKYLTDYTEKATTELLNKFGGFWAFGDAQVEAGKQKFKDLFINDTPISLGMGLICPKKNAKLILDGLDEIQKAGILKDITENGKQGIIIRELYNHECFYTYNIEDAVRKVKAYGYTRDDVAKAFSNEYPNYEKHNS